MTAVQTAPPPSTIPPVPTEPTPRRVSTLKLDTLHQLLLKLADYPPSAPVFCLRYGSDFYPVTEISMSEATLLTSDGQPLTEVRLRLNRSFSELPEDTLRGQSVRVVVELS